MDSSPKPKRVCQKVTPKAMKLRHQSRNEGSTCSSARALDFVAPKPWTVRVGHLPKLFLERNFIINLENIRSKYKIEMDTPGSAVLKCRDYDKRNRTILVDFRSKAIANLMVNKIKENHLMNSTLTASIMNMTHDDVLQTDTDIMDFHDVDAEALKGDAIYDCSTDGSEDEDSMCRRTNDLFLNLPNDELEMQDKAERCIDTSLEPAEPHKSEIEGHISSCRIDTSLEPAEPHKSKIEGHISSCRIDTSLEPAEPHKSKIEGHISSYRIDTSLEPAEPHKSKIEGHISSYRIDTSLEPAEPHNAPTSEVTVSQLPDQFCDSTLKYEIHKALWARTTILKPLKPILSITSSGINEATVTFDSVEAATIAASMIYVDYEDTTVVLKQVFQSLVLSPSVLVTNLPLDYSQEELIYEIHKALWKKTMIKKPQKPILSVSCSGNGEATVTFDSVKAASVAASLQHVDYEDTVVSLKQLSEVAPVKAATCQIKVVSLPLDFDKDDLVYEVHKGLWLSTEIKKPARPIIDAEKIGPSEAILTFDSVHAATIAAGMGSVPYEDTHVDLEQIFENMEQQNAAEMHLVDEEAVNFCSNEVLSSTQIDASPAQIVIVNETVEEIPLQPVTFDKDGWPIVPIHERVRNDWPTYETLRLIEGVLKNRNYLASRATQYISKGWKDTATHMYQHKLYYSVHGMKKTWKRLLATYPSSPKSWEYYNFLAMFHDEQELDLDSLTNVMKTLPRTTQSTTKMSLVEKNKVECGVWAVPGCEPEELSQIFDHEDKTLLLVAEYSSRKKLFEDDKHRALELFGQIRDVFHAKGHKNISAEDCAKRMAYLASRYKQIEDMRLLCTGTGNQMMQNFVYHDIMAQLFEGSAVMKPQKLFACGSSSLMKVRNQEDLTDAEPARKGRKKVSPRGVGKNSYASNVSMVSYRDQKLALGNGLREDIHELLKVVKEQN